MIILRFLENKAFGGCKSQMFVLSYRITGREDGVCKPGRRSMSCRIQKNLLLILNSSKNMSHSFQTQLFSYLKDCYNKIWNMSSTFFFIST